MGYIMRMMLRTFALLVTACTCSAQRMPALGSSPNVGPNRVEVRFAIGKRAVRCSTFALSIRNGQEEVLAGRFRSGFTLRGLPSPTLGELSVRIACGKHRWQFNRVPISALSQGWWWVGTDSPPFQAEFSGGRFRRCRAIRYLIVRPEKREGFDFFETSPPTNEGSKDACTAEEPSVSQ